MNTDQKANIDAAVLALGQNLACAWSYFHLLRGIDQGSRQNTEVIERFGVLYDQAWRAVFDGFFAKVGTLLDNTPRTYSLPNLVTLIRRYGSAELKQLIPKVESSLSLKGSSLSKLKNWRHDAVAHHAADRNLGFYTANKMTLTEIEGALAQLEDLLNHLSLNVLAIHNETRNGSESLVDDGKALFAFAAAGIRSAATADPEV
jgi:hypothetical protein